MLIDVVVVVVVVVTERLPGTVGSRRLTVEVESDKNNRVKVMVVVAVVVLEKRDGDDNKARFGTSDGCGESENACARSSKHSAAMTMATVTVMLRAAQILFFLCMIIVMSGCLTE